METIKIMKDRRKDRNSPVTEQERRKLRGVIGAANWLMSTTRPDVAVHAGLLQQRIQSATVQDLIEANKLVSKIRDYAHVQVVIRSIPIERWSMLLATDASWGNTDDLRSQGGYFVGIADRDILTGKGCQISPTPWKSYKTERHTQSTLGAELMSLAKGMSEADWLRSLIGEALNKDYTLENDKHFRNQIELIITIDNRPIFDHSIGDGVIIRNKREAIDMLLVRREIKQNNIYLRWVETSNMLSDCLTKPTAAAGLLLSVLRGDFYGLKVVEPDSKIYKGECEI